MSFKTLRIKHRPNDSYEVTVDGASRLVPDLRSLNEIIAEIDRAPAQNAGEVDEENIL